MRRTVFAALVWHLVSSAAVVDASPARRSSSKRTPPHAAAPKAPATPLESAKQLFSDGRYAESIPILDDILARAELQGAERTEALFLLGSSHLALGHEPAARARYLELLKTDPEMPLPAYTPRKIQQLFEQLRTEQKERPLLSANTPEIVAGGLGDSVRLHFTAERLHGRTAIVAWRRQGAAAFTEVPLTIASEAGATTELSASLTLPMGNQIQIEYYAEVGDGSGVLARAGSAEEPLRFGRAAIIGDKPIYKKAWFWSVLGVAAAVAGGGVAVYVLTRPAPAPLSNTGTIAVSFGGAGR